MGAMDTQRLCNVGTGAGIGTPANDEKSRDVPTNQKCLKSQARDCGAKKKKKLRKPDKAGIHSREDKWFFEVGRNFVKFVSPKWPGVSSSDVMVGWMSHYFTRSNPTSFTVPAGMKTKRLAIALENRPLKQNSSSKQEQKYCGHFL